MNSRSNKEHPAWHLIYTHKYYFCWELVWVGVVLPGIESSGSWWWVARETGYPKGMRIRKPRRIWRGMMCRSHAPQWSSCRSCTSHPEWRGGRQQLLIGPYLGVTESFSVQSELGLYMLPSFTSFPCCDSLKETTRPEIDLQHNTLTSIDIIGLWIFDNFLYTFAFRIFNWKVSFRLLRHFLK